jgi:hypothetical protein
VEVANNGLRMGEEEGGRHNVVPVERIMIAASGSGSS